jgi:multidrug resistance efflux pump
MRFREEALKARAARDILDLPVRLTSARGWLAALAVLVAVAIGVAWAFFGRLPQEVNALGLLTTPNGSFTVQTTKSGQVTELLVKPGSEVSQGTEVARIREASGDNSTIRSSAAGRVFAVPARTGQVIESGAPLLAAENTDQKSDGLIAAVYIPDAQLANVVPGLPAKVRLSSARGNGAVQGRVLSVGDTSDSAGDLAAFLGDAELAADLVNGGARHRVVISLDLVRGGKNTEYVWTKQNAAIAVNSRSRVAVAIEQPSVRPADWVFPS